MEDIEKLLAGAPHGDVWKEQTFRAIGHFIDAFAAVESVLRTYLAREIKLENKYADAIVTHDFALLCTAVLTVFNETLERDEEKQKLKKCISDARQLNDLRVKVVHGYWEPYFSAGTLHHVSRRTLKKDVVAEMASHLEKQADAADELVQRLQHIFLRTWTIMEEVESERQEDGQGGVDR